MTKESNHQYETVNYLPFLFVLICEVRKLLPCNSIFDKVKAGIYEDFEIDFASISIEE